ncbi:hypothetical protein BDV11DRAFT_131273 [Aspergillus similis]
MDSMNLLAIELRTWQTRTSREQWACWGTAEMNLSSHGGSRYPQGICFGDQPGRLSNCNDYVAAAV